VNSPRRKPAVCREVEKPEEANVETLLFLFALCAAAVVLPLLLLKVLFTLLLLPFKLVGALFNLAFGIVGGLFRVGFGLAVGLFALLAVVVVVVLLPLLPFLIVGGFVWLLARIARPRPALRVIA
jgi:fucose 4-O-acetylase-like acetyltransferase